MDFRFNVPCRSYRPTWRVSLADVSPSLTRLVPLADPRTWSRDDVHRWLHHVSEAHQLPRVFPERFLMNGKALCLMTLDMFVQRVPLGGKLLYKDFQLRLCNAMYA